MTVSKSSANVFGSFLDAIQERTEKRGPDLNVSGHVSGSSVLVKVPQRVSEGSEARGIVPADVLTTVVRCVAGEADAVTIVDLSKHLSLPLDILASTLRDAVGTGLLECEKRPSDAAVTYRITPLGRQVS